MKINFRYIIISLLSVLSLSCVRIEEEMVPSYSEGVELTLTAVREGYDPSTKTVRLEDGSVEWCPSEEISVFYDNGSKGGSKFISQNKEQSPIAEFKGSIDGIMAGGEGFVLDKYIYGIYPYSSTTSFSDGIATISLPSFQTASEGTFSDDLFPTIGRSKGFDIAFYNICGGIKFTVSRNDITSVVFKGNSGERLSGTAKVSFDYQGLPVVLDGNVGRETEITVFAPSGGTFEAGKEYYIVSYPTKLKSGFTMTFRTSGMKEGVYVHSSAVEIKRSVFGVLKQKDSQVSSWQETSYGGGGSESGIYLGIMGFNQELYTSPIARLTFTSKYNFDDFIDDLTKKDGTLLYYSVDRAMDMMQSSQLPSDLETASVVTFTDGLDQGSMMMDVPYVENSEYLEALNDRIKNDKIGGNEIQAYSIGLRGQDVADVTSFRKNLSYLASSPANAMEVTSMDEVNQKFKEIAEKLSYESYLQTINLKIPGVSNGTVVRFTLDNADSATSSRLYIEGIFDLASRSLKNVRYSGMNCISGTEVKGTVDGIFVTFTFEDIKTETGSVIKNQSIDEWTYVESNNIWQINSEFDKEDNTEIINERSSALIVLVLDCSSSLADDFVKVQSNAKDFINTLYDVADGKGTDDDLVVPELPSDPGVVDLSEDGTANSYIVSKSGSYKFTPTKGNSSNSVGIIAKAETLWESFGTSVAPKVGDLVKDVRYEKGFITFRTADTFKEGNAVIAAKDADGNILWSWHIWLTDQPEDQVYYNNAGTMMDRNLGATSATPGDVGALGLLYQWGRKDPFLGSSSISSNIEAKSTGTWPSAVSSNSTNGTIEYATAYPTTFIKYNSSNNDWHYTGSSSTDNTRWTTSESSKSIYDPCPSGWRVPDGSSNGIWAKALGSKNSFKHDYDSTNEGMNFSGKFGSASTIWYPASGYRDYDGRGLRHVGFSGSFLSASPNGYGVCDMYLYSDGDVNTWGNSYRAFGMSVRCIREGTGDGSSDSGDSSISTSSAVSLTTTGTSNSYIVSQKGTYSFPTVKGNSSASVGSVESAEVLWESFGTDVTPEEGDLVSAALYRDGNIYFKTADTFKEGNAVIAAKDASGKILWSWHIWLTDQPEEQVYYNNAGTMMDRNLGATSATPGDVGALGLLYQWGRKDPFLGSSSISSSTLAKSTIAWPSSVYSNSTRGTRAYATANPTTFIRYNSYNYDWYYTGSSTTDNTRWTTSYKTKSIYDPCPSGWRVPDGGDNGIWSKALGSSSAFTQSSLYDSTNEGMNFSGKFGSDQTIWYPASGYRSFNDGSLNYVGDLGYYWSASPNNDPAFSLVLYYDGGLVNPSSNDFRAFGMSVRCIREGTGDGSSDSGDSSISTSSAVSLTTTGTSNSYIVSQKGTYSFPTVKGNSSASVGSVESAEVLWESFGTDVTPEEGDLVSAALYRDGNIYFKTADTFKEGNAVIAAKDASGKILWSWHIWLTDQPEEQVYYNNAGTMMDRNLGATSATPGDVGALGLLYQWGRKDPFLGSSSISSSTLAKSTIAWPSSVYSNSTRGTRAYATANPTTFIRYNSYNYDWYYTGSSTTDNTRWTTSYKTKSIYDPCPSGWRVPDGGDNGIWSKALGSRSYFTQSSLYDSTNRGMNFSGKFGSASTIWYPASGCRYDDGSLGYVGNHGDYWSASPGSLDPYCAYGLDFSYDGCVVPSINYDDRATGRSVRCIQE